MPRIDIIADISWLAGIWEICVFSFDKDILVSQTIYQLN